VDIHFVIYYWTVLIYKMSNEDISLLPVSEICLKLLAIVLLLILSKTSVFIAYHNISFHIFHSFYLEVITRLFSYRPVYQGRASIISPRW